MKLSSRGDIHLADLLHPKDNLSYQGLSIRSKRQNLKLHANDAFLNGITQINLRFCYANH